MTGTNELYKMWKKLFVIQFKIPSRYLPAGSGETHFSSIVCVPAESGTRHLPSTRQNSCRYFTLLVPAPGELKRTIGSRGHTENRRRIGLMSWNVSAN
jgi:hypothetical protein